MLVCAVLLVFVYYVHQKQALAKSSWQGTLKFQTELKLLHVVFANQQSKYFGTTFLLFFIDTMIF